MPLFTLVVSLFLVFVVIRGDGPKFLKLATTPQPQGSGTVSGSGSASMSNSTEAAIASQIPAIGSPSSTPLPALPALPSGASLAQLKQMIQSNHLSNLPGA